MILVLIGGELMEKTCASRSFKALMTAQFVGALIDNAFKIMISLMVMETVSSSGDAAKFISLIGLIFILPFVVISPYAGLLADRFSKRSIIIFLEGVKIFNAVIALFALLSGNFWFLCLVLLMMTVESAFFSPAKYGILPEMLDESELSRGNGFMQMWTFGAVIFGTAVAGKLLEIFSGRIYWAAIIFISIIGLLAGMMIKEPGIVDKQKATNKNGFRQIQGAFNGIVKDRGLLLSMMALGYFSFLGAAFQMNILIYGTRILDLTQSQVSSLLVAVLSGIALGGLLAGRLSEKKIEMGLVPLGALGIVVFCLALGLVPSNRAFVLADLFFLGMSAGFYTVPLNAFYQRFSPEGQRGCYLSVLNIISGISILGASGFLWFLGSIWGVSAAGIFLVLGCVSVIVLTVIIRILPEALVRLINWLIAHSIYRVRVSGVKHVPAQNGGLIVANHTSFVDAVFILASLSRPVRFVMNQTMYELPIINWLCRTMRVIPIDQQGGPKAIASALSVARQAIENGELVCIFPEGHLTRTGNMLPFRRGFKHIIKDMDVPIIPVYLDNLWGSIFSYDQGKYFWKFPRSTRYPVSVIFGKPLTCTTPDYQVRLAVQELGAEANMMRGVYRQKLHLSFIDEVKRHTFGFCMADSSGLQFRYFEVLAGALAMSRTIFAHSRRPMETNEMVGVLLPSSCVAAMTNLAVAISGKVPVNLNFTLSREAFDSCIRQCRMQTIITSRMFLEKIKMEPRSEMVFLEDLRSGISPIRKFLLALCSVVLPGELLKRIFVKGDRRNVDDVATVIFSSGSTGEPKGVMLSHANIFSNIEGFYQVFDIKRNDVVMAALPFFHSFGFTATLCFPIGTGIGVVYHSNPMDALTIGKLTQKYRATIIMGTPTFMSSYVRKCTIEHFASLRLAIVGAEKLKDSLAQAFFEKFKVLPLEGYGATELSPIVTVGFPDYFNEQTLERQLGYKAGKVGHPIPGVAVKVVDPDTGDAKGYDEEGLLLVKGANVMKGYLNDPLKTNEVIKDGWYVTGDIAAIDSDGLLKITDRLSRFSKIGGEMVPHIKIEENIMELIGAVDSVVAVTSVPDVKKGEKIIVLHTVDIDAGMICEGLVNRGLPNLWIPKTDQFYRVEAIPVLGTGKVDLKQLKIMAQQLTSDC